MKIRLLVDIPVGTGHGLVAGRVLEAQRLPDNERKGRESPRWMVCSDQLEEVGILYREAEVVPAGQEGEGGDR